MRSQYPPGYTMRKTDLPPTGASHMGVTRRHFLGQLAGVGAGAVLVGTGAVDLRRDVAAGGVPPAFVQPEVLESAHGALDVELVARARQVPWGTGTRYALTYNGTTPGPTLVVRPGDRVRVTLV